MMENDQFWNTARVSCLVLTILVACGGGSGTTSTRPGTPTPGTGICQASCTKDCNNDQDCDLARGNMCCDLRGAGKTCMSAALCPVTCDDDNVCDSSKGLACLRTSLAATDRTCLKSADTFALRLCKDDKECLTGNVCCTIYNEGVCLLPTRCPKACSQSDECDTASGEICCTTANLREPSLAGAGLCLNPKNEVCPKACKQSSECGTTVGELCCNGLCSKTCPKSCTQSSDCSGQLCCKSALMRVSPPTYFFNGGSSGASAKCRDVSTALCQWLYRCGGSAALASIGATSVASCTSTLVGGSCTSTASGCGPGEVYHMDMAQQCIYALSIATCPSSNYDLLSNPPAACDLICQ